MTETLFLFLHYCGLTVVYFAFVFFVLIVTIAAVGLLLLVWSVLMGDFDTDLPS